uniref:Uncharacterized protein n=1 Tax=Anguilla anguilla TaxID=7936 RepID=A0A0E9W957_ANGAN
MFHARFERENSEPTNKMANHPEDYVLQLSESEVRRTFRRVKASSAHHCSSRSSQCSSKRQPLCRYPRRQR